jgi:hypothetical protein
MGTGAEDEIQLTTLEDAARVPSTTSSLPTAGFARLDIAEVKANPTFTLEEVVGVD